MKFLDLFQPIVKGNFGLTEEAVYKSVQLDNKKIPLWGGNQEHIHADRFVDEKAKTKYGDSINVFEGEGIIISLDGSAGSMTYKKKGLFSLNHHAGFFKPRESGLIDMEFFSIFYEEQMKEASVSEGSKTLTIKKIESMNFDVPKRDTQRKIMDKMCILLERRRKIWGTIGKIRSLNSKRLLMKYKNYQGRDVPIRDVLKCMSGNSGLTEKEIYQTSATNQERYRVLSGSASEESGFGQVPIFQLNGKNIEVFEDQDGILVSRKGKAGTTKFLKSGKYTLTDDAYILYLLKDPTYEVLLKWIMIQYAGVFFEYASSSDNGTWNMTGFFKNVQIDIPDIGEQQNVVDEYEKLETLEKQMLKIDNKISSLFSRKFVDTPT